MIVAVGDEVLTGEVLNTNGAWLGQALLAAGSRVTQQVLVPDDEAAIRDTLLSAWQTADLVVLVGGLGPTPDDRTRDGVAAALGVGMAVDPLLEARIRLRHGRHPGSEASIRRQSLVLDTATVLPNRVGTAPGQLLLRQDKAVALLPGPPWECRDVAEGFLREVERRTGRRIVRATWRCYGLTESEFAHHLGDLLTSGSFRAGVYVRPGVVELRLEASLGDDAAEAMELLSRAGAEARSRVPVPLYDDQVPIEPARLIDALARRGETVSLAESLTGGLLAAELTDVPGASAVVLDGQVVYTDEAKVRLGIDRHLLAEAGAVSEPVARALAELSRQRSGATWGLGLTGYAGPSGGTTSDPVGTYYCAVAGQNGTVVHRRRTRSGREVVRLAAAETARFLLARELVTGPNLDSEDDR